MTHTHHRLGDADALREEFIFLTRTDPAVPAQRSWAGPLARRMRTAARILAEHQPAGLDVRVGERQLRFLRGAPAEARREHADFVTLENIRTHPGVTEVRHALFTSRASAEGALRDLKAADLGISIVVTGVLEEVFGLCAACGLAPHTVSMSLGVWGRTERLPHRDHLELCTMCGHGVVSHTLAAELSEAVAQGEASPARAAFSLARQCVCNIVGLERAAVILERRAPVPDTGNGATS